jgi:hypothetical protein
MMRSKLRIILLVAFVGAAICVLAVVLLDAVKSRPGSLHITLLCATNEGPSGVSAVLLIQNNLKEYIHLQGVFLQKQSRRSWAIDTIAQFQGPDYISPGTNLLRVKWSSTAEVDVRVLALCKPVSKEAPEFYKTTRYRVATCIRRLGLLRFLWMRGVESAGMAEWRLDGMVLVPSRPFRPPHNKPVQAPAG